MLVLDCQIMSVEPRASDRSGLDAAAGEAATWLNASSTVC
jgi:hypothetical protein